MKYVNSKTIVYHKDKVWSMRFLNLSDYHLKTMKDTYTV